MEETQNQDEILRLKMQKIQGAYEFLYARLQNEAHQWAEEFRGNLDRSVSELVEELRASGVRANGGTLHFDFDKLEPQVEKSKTE